MRRIESQGRNQQAVGCGCWVEWKKVIQSWATKGEQGQRSASPRSGWGARLWNCEFLTSNQHSTFLLDLLWNTPIHWEHRIIGLRGKFHLFLSLSQFGTEFSNLAAGPSTPARMFLVLEILWASETAQAGQLIIVVTITWDKERNILLVLWEFCS